MTLADQVFALLRVFEGCKLTAYQDSGGVWTIGIGHTAGVKAGDTCTEEQASAWLAEDAAALFSIVPISPWRSAAYISFGYNAGRTSLELVLAGKAQLSSYIHDRHGNVLPGLVARRGLEAALIG